MHLKNRQPKVCFILPSMACGGVESFVLRTGVYLQKKGCVVDVLTTQSPGKQFGEIAENGLRGSSLPYSQATLPIRHGRRIASLLAEREYDIVFNNQCQLTQILAAQLPDHCTVITVLHGNVDWLYQQYLTNEEAINLYIGISPAIIDRARSILKSRPIVFVPHGFDFPQVGNRTNQHPPSRSNVNLLFAGRLEDEDKGVFLLPDILASLRKSGISATLRIAGAGSCQQELLAKFEARRVHEQVQLLGYLSKSELYAEYRKAHVLLFPSRHEGFGLSLIESMAHGCVPVSSLIPGVTDCIISQGDDGILAPVGDVQAFADGVSILCNIPEKWLSMSAAGPVKVEKNYSFTKNGESYWNIVNRAVNGEYALLTARHLLPRYDKRLLRPRHFMPGWLMQLFVRLSVSRGISATGTARLWQTENKN